MRGIDAAAWLASHDIKAYLDAAFADPDPLALGREALAMAGGDLLYACQQQEELKAEIVLAWLHEKGGGVEMVEAAALTLEEAGGG